MKWRQALIVTAFAWIVGCQESPIIKNRGVPGPGMGVSQTAVTDAKTTSASDPPKTPSDAVPASPTIRQVAAVQPKEDDVEMLSQPLPNGGKPAARPVEKAVAKGRSEKRIPEKGSAAGGRGVPDGVASTSETMDLGLNDAIETGLSRNPDLVALRESEGVGKALVGVARTYPFNPTLQARILPYNKFDGRDTPTYNYVLLWQQFELAHQRRFRTQNATATLNATHWTIQQAEMQNVALTTQLYFVALYQRGLQELAELTARVNDELLDVMEKRLKAGKAAAADVAMVRIDTRTSRQQALLAKVNHRNALLALRRQLNIPPETELKLRGDLTDFAWHPVTSAELNRLFGETSDFTAAMDQGGIVTQLAARRPDVLAARATAEAGQANLRLARASRIPNLWLGPFYSRDAEGIVSLGFQAQMDVPVVNTGRPLVRQREAELRQQLTSSEQLEAKAKVETRTALDRYEQARLIYQQTKQEANQELPQELKKLEEQFRAGEVDIMRIFQARNSLLLFRKTYLDSLNEVAQAAAVLAAAGGLPPAALISPPTGQQERLPPPEPTQALVPERGAVLLPAAAETPP